MATGNTAEVFEYDEGKVCKLFKDGYPLDSIKREFETFCRHLEATEMHLSFLRFLAPKAVQRRQLPSKFVDHHRLTCADAADEDKVRRIDGN